VVHHGILIGLFSGTDYIVRSNREAGEGRYDIMIQAPDTWWTVIIELKNAAREKPAAFLNSPA